MKKRIIIVLIVSAMLIAGVFLAGCTSDTGSSAAATGSTLSGQAAITSVSPAEVNEKPSGTPPAGLEMNGTPPSGTPPEGMGMNKTKPSGTPPTDMQNRGEPPSGTPPSGTPASGTPSAGT